ncbi:hypothetical protein MHU86_6721 [Fragilaria crotonensis]|nr:hypothetical protein MHU86_6721 [Fragilaria crotonensis]
MTSSPFAVVIITGGGGFLGQCLASALLKKGTIHSECNNFSNVAVPISKMILADIHFSTLQPAIQEAQLNLQVVVKMIQGDVSDSSFCDKLYDEAVVGTESSTTTQVSVFHLGAVMSGDGERDFDLCMRVNLHGVINMLEGARRLTKSGFSTKFIFASAGAIIGSGADTDHISKDDTISDASRAAPHTTYGATKACCELLLSDYARRGFVDARALRLPSIVVRAGTPNAATTGCFSAVIREPLSGVNVELPIARHVPHAVTGTRAAISAMILLHDKERTTIEQVLGFDRTIFLPAVALSLGDLEEALYNVVAPESKGRLGKITYKVDERLSAIVESFPTKIHAGRAMKLGIPAAPNAETVVREYIADFNASIAQGICILPESKPFLLPVSVEKVAVVTGGGSGIGRAVAERLSRGGWTLVLAGRRLDALKETQALLEGNECLCVQADVTMEADVERLFSEAESKYGRVDLLFNNAGINSVAASIENVTFADFERVLKTNVCGPFLCARAAMRIMAKHGGGRIINNGSLSAHVPRPGSASYSTSKHALLGLTKCIALDGRAINVACGQIDFGNVVSELSLQTNKVGAGAMQSNGTTMVEPFMTLNDAAETLWTMANLPLEANVLQMTVMASGMPFVGRG